MSHASNPDPKPLPVPSQPQPLLAEHQVTTRWSRTRHPNPSYGGARGGLAVSYGRGTPVLSGRGARHLGPGTPTTNDTPGCRRWRSNPPGKCSYERPTRGTVCGTMRSTSGADAGCLAMIYQSFYRDYSKLRTHTAVGPYGRCMRRSMGPS